MSEPGRPHLLDRAGSGALTVAAALLYLGLAIAYAAHWPPAHDEGVTWRQSLGRAPLPVAPAQPVAIASLYDFLDGRQAHSLSDLAEALGEEGGMHPPAYYAFMRIYSQAFGTGRLAARVPALLVGLLSLAGLAWLGRSLLPRTDAGGWAALLLAVSPWFIGFSCFLRPYGLALCIGIGSTALLVSGLSGRRQRGWALAFAALGALGLFTLYHYVFVLLWQGTLWGLHAISLRGEPARRELFRLAGVSALVALCFAPWLGQFAEQLESTRGADYYFAGLPPLSSWPAHFARSLKIFALAEALRGPLAQGLSLLAGFLAIATIALLASGRRQPEVAPPQPGVVRWFWISVPVLPLAVAISDLVLSTHTLFITKTVFLLLPLGLLGIVAAWKRALPARFANAGLLAWAALGLAASASVLVAVLPAPTPVDQAVAGVRAFDRPEHVVVLSSGRAGGVFPLLRVMRESQVAQARIVVVPARRARRQVEAMLRDETILALTLLDPDTRGRGEGLWDAELLADLAQTARAAGWRVRRSRALGARSAPAAGERRLWIVPALQVKFFAM